MTTTCPIHLRLVNDPNASDDTPITVSSGQMHQMSVLDTAVSEAVLTMMESIRDASDGIISSVPIVIEVRRPDVPSLQLVDLPGIVTATTSVAERISCLSERSSGLAEEYIRQPNTIVLAVVPAGILRVRDSGAMQVTLGFSHQDKTVSGPRSRSNICINRSAKHAMCVIHS